MKISDNFELYPEKEGTGTYLPLESEGTFIFKMNLDKKSDEWLPSDFYAMASNSHCSWEVECPVDDNFEEVGYFFHPELKKVIPV